MDPFSYLAVLLSIILGLGLTQLLTAVGRLIRHRESVRMHPLPLVWAAILLLIYVQVWWSMYGLRLRRDWSFPAFGVVLAQTAALYLMAAVALPEQVTDGGVDLGEYFDRQHRWFFGCFLATLIISVLKDVVLAGTLPSPLNLGFHGAFALGCVVGLVVRSRHGQSVLAGGFAITIVAYIASLFTQLH